MWRFYRTAPPLSLPVVLLQEWEGWHKTLTKFNKLGIISASIYSLVVWLDGFALSLPYPPFSLVQFVSIRLEFLWIWQLLWRLVVVVHGARLVPCCDVIFIETEIMVIFHYIVKNKNIYSHPNVYVPTVHVKHNVNYACCSQMNSVRLTISQPTNQPDCLEGWGHGRDEVLRFWFQALTNPKGIPLPQRWKVHP